MSERERVDRVRWAALMGAVGAAWFVAITVAVSLMRPDVDPQRHYVSELVHGPFGGLVSGAFVLHGATTLAFARGIGAALPAGRGRFALVALTSFAGLALFLMAVFPADHRGGPYTLVGLVHGVLAALVLTALAASAMLFDRIMPHRPALGALRRAASTLGVAVLCAYGTFAALTVGHLVDLWDARPLLGVGQRVAVAAGVLWLIAVSSIVYRAVDGDADRPAGSMEPGRVGGPA